MRTLTRFILDIVLVVSVVNGWWFVALPICLVGAWSFGYYLECILAGMAYDALFGSAVGTGSRSYAGTIVSILAFAGVSALRNVARR